MSTYEPVQGGAACPIFPKRGPRAVVLCDGTPPPAQCTTSGESCQKIEDTAASVLIGYGCQPGGAPADGGGSDAAPSDGGAG